MEVKKKQKKQPKKHHKQLKPQGHFCYVCGENKPNEKFSGRGHATHICKQCHALPVAERNEIIAIRKIENMASRYLSETEIKWLRKKMNSSNPGIRETARDVHSLKFPHYERNMIKKGLTARSLEFFIHGEVWDEYGDEISVNMRFFADNSGVLRRIDYDAPEGERETSINTGQQAALKFLKAVVHQFDALFWSDDLSDAQYKYDPYLDVLPEYRPDFDEDDDDDESYDEIELPDKDDREPIWSLRLVLNKGGEKTQTFYNQMHNAPQELFWSLMSWFDPEDEFDEDEFEEENSEIE